MLLSVCFNFHNNTYKVWRSVDVTIIIDCQPNHFAEWKEYLTDMGLTDLEKGLFYYPSLTPSLIPDSVIISHSCSSIKSNLTLRPQLLLSIPALCNFKLSRNKIPHLLVIPFQCPTQELPTTSYSPAFLSLCPLLLATAVTTALAALTCPFLLCFPSCLRRGFRWRTQVAFTNNPSKQSSKEIKVGHMKKFVIVLM